MRSLPAIAILMAELLRYRRSIFESVIAPITTSLLYVFIFGLADAGHSGNATVHVFPGVLFLMIASEAFNSTSYGIFLPRFSGAIYEIVTSPATKFEIIAGYLLSAILRVLAIGCGFALLSWLLFDVVISHPAALLATAIYSAICFAMVGLIVGIQSREFEQIPIIPAFVIMPLVFLGGTFIEVARMPGLWPQILAFNPLAAFVTAFRLYSQGSSANQTELEWFDLVCMASVFVIATTILAYLFQTNRHRRTFAY